ncbi:MAG: HAMP domain-containing protein, partial [Oceanicaulis sp.]
MKLSSLSILQKILLIVAVMGAGAALVAGAGALGAARLGEAVDAVDSAGDRALLSAEMEAISIALSRAEYRLAVEPGEADAIAADIADRRTRLRDLVGRLEETSSGDARTALGAVRDTLEEYRAELERMIALARRSGAEEMSLTEQALLEQVRRSREQAAELRASIGVLTAAYAERAADEREAAHGASKLAMVAVVAAALISILAGAGVAILIARNAIAQPVRRVVGRAETLASGDLETEISETERRDEIGVLNKTLAVFLSNMREQAEMRAEREADMARR